MADMLQMTDGHCASTCALLAMLLKKQGVKSIAFGGRPRYGPMQAVGGVKGGQYWSLSTISHYIERARELAFNASRAGFPILSLEELDRFNKLMPPSVTDFPLRFGGYGQSSVNVRNAYGPDDDMTPLQFKYEAADCRLFFTAENVVNPHTTWAAAARAMFGDGSCVDGSRLGNGGETQSRT
jgi:hypothetical protein